MTFGPYSIRLIEKKDAESFFAVIDRNYDRICTYLPQTADRNQHLQGTLEYIEERMKLAKERTFFAYVIVHESAGQILGAIFLKEFNWVIPKCELGYFVDKDYEGRGVMSLAMKQIIRHCFEEMKLNKLLIRVADENISSIRLAEKTGFIREGTIRMDFKTMSGQLLDIHYYGLTNEIGTKN